MLRDDHFPSTSTSRTYICFSYGNLSLEVHQTGRFSYLVGAYSSRPHYSKAAYWEQTRISRASGHMGHSRAREHMGFSLVIGLPTTYWRYFISTSFKESSTPIWQGLHPRELAWTKTAPNLTQLGGQEFFKNSDGSRLQVPSWGIGFTPKFSIIHLHPGPGVSW